eukprot:7380639-Prymnesium_polylepis.1
MPPHWADEAGSDARAADVIVEPADSCRTTTCTRGRQIARPGNPWDKCDERRLECLAMLYGRLQMCCSCSQRCSNVLESTAPCNRGSSDLRRRQIFPPRRARAQRFQESTHDPKGNECTPSQKADWWPKSESQPGRAMALLIPPCSRSRARTTDRKSHPCRPGTCPTCILRTFQAASSVPHPRLRSVSAGRCPWG